MTKQLQSSRDTSNLLRKEIEFLNLGMNINIEKANAIVNDRRKNRKGEIEDPALHKFWTDLQKSNLAPPEALKTLGKSADYGKLWAEIQRLEKELEAAKPKTVPVAPEPIKVNPPPPPPPAAPKAPGAPPPPGMMPSFKTDDKIIKSKLPMKPLNWQKLPKHTLQDSQWPKLFKDAYSQQLINSQELDSLFIKSSTAPKNNRRSSRREKEQIVTFMDTKNSTNLGTFHLNRNYINFS